MEFTKWDHREHWSFDTDWLGDDEHGVWLGIALGCVATSPLGSFAWDRIAVMLIPYDEPWTAQFMTPATGPTMTDHLVYVDITTPAAWNGDTVTMVDLDLDVVRSADGSVFVDDEDEFAEHAANWEYPAEVVSLAEKSCATTVARLAEEREPFGAVGAAWLTRAQQWAG